MNSEMYLARVRQAKIGPVFYGRVVPQGNTPAGTDPALGLVHEQMRHVQGLKVQPVRGLYTLAAQELGIE